MKKEALKITYRSVVELIPYAKNARHHSPNQIEQLAQSIKEFGWTNPILIDEDNGIIAGHGRVLAAQFLNLKEVPVIVLGELTPAQKRLYILADNKLAENSEWQLPMLAAEISDLKNLGDMLRFSGFDDVDLKILAEGVSLTFYEAPDSVAANIQRMKEIKEQRKRGTDNVISKSDTERYLIIVFPSREAKGFALRQMGLPEDERYLDHESVVMHIRVNGAYRTSETDREYKSAPINKSGAHG